MRRGGKAFIVAAGGTGGHMMPAHALAEALVGRGHRVALITDERGAKFETLLTNGPRHVIQAATPGRNPLRWPSAWLKIRAGRKAAARIIAELSPAAVIGFGGYPVLPAMLAAQRAGIPTILHEQNAVLGRVNRLVAGKADVIATSFPDTLNVKHPDKVSLVGNPVRAEIAAIGRTPYPAFAPDDIFRLLVTGGSLGASIFASVVPAALAELDPGLRHRLQVTQQCRAEDIDKVRAEYRRLEIPADLMTFIDDMPGALALAHLVIGRAGASTVSELCAAGRPAILVPLPIATDDHQAANTREMVAAGGARMMRQNAFTPHELARQIEAMALAPGALANAAKRALSVGRPNAAATLADLAERLAGVPMPVDIQPIDNGAAA
jgi:UDP-N-acetylglucosamine--N-acetylmuramyl-(pentapeptide) pyrophosphoryl-undecaprenol N-acetylglucosamine transferase